MARSVRDADVVFIGAGPAGCAAAVFLHQRVPEVVSGSVMLERAQFPRAKGCGGGLTGRVAPFLKKMGLPSNPTGALEVQRMRLFHGERITRLVLPRAIPVARRWEFDEVLANHARERVGDLRQDEPARRIRRVGDSLEVETDRATYRTQLVIDASGSRCISRRCGLLPQGRRPVPVWVAEGPPAPDEPAFDGELELRFDFTEMANGCPGYYWSFPCRERGERFVSRGFYPAGGLATAPAREALDRRLRANGVDPQGVKVVAYPARLFSSDNVCAAPGLMAVGDAAGVDPVFGEGISQSLEYGWLAAKAAARALKRRRFDFGARHHLPLAGMGGRLLYLAKMHDEFYIPDYERRLAFALNSPTFQRIVYADSAGTVPGPLLWSSGAVLGLITKTFTELELDTPRDKTVVL